MQGHEDHFPSLSYGNIPVDSSKIHCLGNGIQRPLTAYSFALPRPFDDHKNPMKRDSFLHPTEIGTEAWAK